MSKSFAATLSAIFSVCMTAGPLSAAPAISSDGVSVSYDAAQNVVTVTYTLENESAVVTAAFLKNGERIPGEGCRNLFGDVNRSVDVGERTFTWKPSLKDDDGVFGAGELSVRLTLWPAGNEPPYLVAELSEATDDFRYYASDEDIPEGVTNDVYKTEKLVLRRIPAAGESFMMGSPVDEEGRSANELQHEVKITTDYYIGVYPVTQRQVFMVTNEYATSIFTNARDSAMRPADSCSLKLVRGRFAGEAGTQVPLKASVLGAFRARTGLSLDLPTEAEWEFAVRAGMSAPIWDDLDDIAWYSGNSGGETHPVGRKLQNAFGLFDMHGNVRELVLDTFVQDPPSGDDPYYGKEGDAVYRSGGFDQDASDCRAARRAHASWSNTDTHNGFRVAIRKYARSSEPTVTVDGVLAEAVVLAGCRSGVSAPANFNPLKGLRLYVR